MHDKCFVFSYIVSLYQTHVLLIFHMNLFRMNSYVIGTCTIQFSAYGLKFAQLFIVCKLGKFVRIFKSIIRLRLLMHSK